MEQPKTPAGGANAVKNDKKDRLSEALRANLARRKLGVAAQKDTKKEP